MTERQRKFCEIYAEIYNATEAYWQAFDTCNRNNARKKGWELLQIPEIKEYIRECQKAMINVPQLMRIKLFFCWTKLPATQKKNLPTE